MVAHCVKTPTGTKQLQRIHVEIRVRRRCRDRHHHLCGGSRFFLAEGSFSCCHVETPQMEEAVFRCLRHLLVDCMLVACRTETKNKEQTILGDGHDGPPSVALTDLGTFHSFVDNMTRCTPIA